MAILSGSIYANDSRTHLIIVVAVMCKGYKVEERGVVNVNKNILAHQINSGTHLICITDTFAPEAVRHFNTAIYPV